MIHVYYHARTAVLAYMLVNKCSTVAKAKRPPPSSPPYVRDLSALLLELNLSYSKTISFTVHHGRITSSPTDLLSETHCPSLPPFIHLPAVAPSTAQTSITSCFNLTSCQQLSSWVCLHMLANYFDSISFASIAAPANMAKCRICRNHGNHSLYDIP